jgi:hypothetical protein
MMSIRKIILIDFFWRAMKMPGASKLHHIEMASGSLWAPLSGQGKILFAGVGYSIQENAAIHPALRGTMRAKLLSLCMPNFSPHQRPPGGSDRDVLG